MSLTLPRNSLLKILNVLAPLTKAKSKTAHETSMALCAVDGVLSANVHVGTHRVELTIPYEDGGFAEVWVNARMLLDCIRSVRGSVTLAESPASLLVTAEDAAFNLTRGAEGLTNLPVYEGGALVVNADNLRTLIDRVAPYTYTDGLYRGLDSLNLELKDGTLLAVATDGVRLGTATVPAAGVLEIGKNLGLAASTCAILRKLPLVGDVRFTFHQGNVRVDADGVALTAKLTEREYPDWRAVMPVDVESTRRFTFDRDAMMTGVRRGGKMTAPRSATVFDFTEGRVVVKSKHADRGSASATVPVGLVGDPVSVGLNPSFVLTTLGVLPKGPVVVSFNGGLGPTVWHSLVDSTVFGVLMSMRVD